MTKQVIGIGTNPNDGNGDPLRTAFTKVNANFTELYNIAASPYQLPTASGNVLGGVKIGNNISIFNGVISVASQVQPDWDAVSGLGQILNKPNDNELTNDIWTLRLNASGITETPGDIRLTDQKKIMSVNGNVNGGQGGDGIVGWFTHPDPAFEDEQNTKAWGLDAPGDIVIKNIGASGPSRYWKFSRTGDFVLPQYGDIKNSDGESVLVTPALYLQISVLKQLVAESTSFEDFQTKIATL